VARKHSESIWCAAKEFQKKDPVRRALCAADYRDINQFFIFKSKSDRRKG
jgi:hypothetical protein